ncbi:type VI secretion system baseplate subunit TssE [Serratia microhaemolytica]|uniref:type VI secretion system baseplate subunit TssE n=1 Tax=Serratia microhaemolytica TaxID=2675110 RepID=UPI000FDDB277|nr:type VI secretion system baseplate subunit TssE [Serratia microhaemolytica]
MAALLTWRRGSSASLFERIQEKERRSSPDSRVQELLISVKRHLNKVLNTRPGACESTVDLGVTDFNDATATTTDFRKSIEEAIKLCIEEYEPRVADVTVESILDNDDPLLLGFRINAYINFGDEGELVEFNIHLDNNRRYYLNQEA